jgi:uncharacterized protein (TIGR03663 family)
MDFKAKIKEEWPEIAILVVAAVARLTLLSIKPPHFDEGVNGWFVDQMTHTGFYHYDPENYHGPLHFYVLFLAQALLGRHIWVLRLPLVMVSLATVWLTMRFDRFVGRGAALWAAAAMAVSPGSVFYARYAIHEGWLVLSLMMCAWGLAGLWKYGERKYLWAVWIGVTGAVLTKETYVIHFGCAALALPCAWAVGMLSPASDADAAARQEWTGKDMALGALFFVGCVVFFYSGTFMDMAGLKGLYTTFGAWFQTGKTGNGHEKSWYYWLKLFGMYEWPSCVGLALAVVSVLPRVPRLPRVLAIYGCGTLLAYSIIHYKTPWCIVSLTWPFLLLFGAGVELGCRKYGPPVGVLAATLLAANLCDMARLNFHHYTDAKQPYVYVQTFKDVNRLMDPLNELVAQNRANYELSGSIIMDSYHPLPWLLGDFPNVGYYGDDNTPGKMDADFLLVEDTRIDDVENALREEYFTEPLKLRDAEDTARLYLSVKKFQVVFPGRTPNFVPSMEAPKATEGKKASPTPVAGDRSP